MTVRLQKFLAEAGFGSRRYCESLITSGDVSINGQPVTTLGTKLDPATDQVHVAGKLITIERKVYLALNKPAGYLCTSADTHGRKIVLDLVPADLPRLYSVGRLDQDTEGLLFLTNDGNFSLRLTHPRYKMPKLYRVEVTGEWSADAPARLLQGVRSDGEMLRAEKILDVCRQGVVTVVELELREGKKRQVRRMMQAVGCRVQRLTRLAVGTITLGNLKPGQWRYLKDEEVRGLLAD